MGLDGISLTETDGQVFLRHQPAVGRPPVDAAMLHALLEEAGYAACHLDEEAIARVANDCNTQVTPFVVQVADRRDAAIKVEIAADEMAAQVSLTPPQGGKPASIEDVLKALAEAGVVFGIDQSALTEACALGQAVHVPVAKGAQPENGRDTGFEPLLPKTTDRAPKLDANGLIDYREHGGITVVRPGEPLMRRVPPTPGVAGHTVRGRELPARAGVIEMFTPQLAGVQVAPDDPNLLQAAVIGQPVLANHGVTVEPILRLAEVNLASGNIYFDGTVQVDGEVLHGMKVQASGDIVVAGTVEGGLLEAGGDIHVACGVIAQARLKATGSVSARFAEHSTIHAGMVIALDDMALECELESLNQIIIGAKVPKKGRLVGGSATAMMLLRVPLLGSNKSGVTRVKVGANAELEQQLKDLDERLAKEKATEENLQKLLKHLTASGDPKGMLERVKASWRQAVQTWSKSLAERVELEKEMAVTLLAKVEVGIGVDGSVDLAFGSKTTPLRKEFSDGAFSFAPETGIVFTNSAGTVVTVAA